MTNLTGVPTGNAWASCRPTPQRMLDSVFFESVSDADKGEVPIPGSVVDLDRQLEGVEALGRSEIRSRLAGAGGLGEGMPQ